MLKDDVHPPHVENQPRGFPTHEVTGDPYRMGRICKIPLIRLNSFGLLQESDEMVEATVTWDQNNPKTKTIMTTCHRPLD